MKEISCKVALLLKNKRPKSYFRNKKRRFRDEYCIFEKIFSLMRKRNFLFLFFIFLGFLNLNAQQHCLYETQTLELLSKNELIMLGEIHGTEQPAQLAEELVNYCSQEDTVLLLLEIHHSFLADYNKNRNIDSLRATKLFNGKSTDGRGTSAWFNLLSNLKNNQRVIIKGFDVARYSPQRDSIMAENVIDILTKENGKKAILLSGNIHNCWNIKESLNIKPMAYFLHHKLPLTLKKKSIAINIAWAKGQALVNMGKGLEVYDLPKRNIDKSIACNRYIYKVKRATKGYDYIAFFKEITPAKLLEVFEK